MSTLQLLHKHAAALDEQRKSNRARDIRRAMANLRKSRVDLGLTVEGRPRRNGQRFGLCKDHAAYMKLWRYEKFVSKGLRADGLPRVRKLKEAA